MNRKKIVISSVSEKSNETNGIPHFVRNDGKNWKNAAKSRRDDMWITPYKMRGEEKAIAGQAVRLAFDTSINSAHRFAQAPRSLTARNDKMFLLTTNH